MIAWTIHKPFVHPPEKEPVLLGYGKLLGGEPVFLPAEDAAEWDRDDAWMDLDAWRRWVGGTLTDHKTKLLTETELSNVSLRYRLSPGRSVPWFLRLTAKSGKAAVADHMPEPSGQH